MRVLGVLGALAAAAAAAACGGGGGAHALKLNTRVRVPARVAFSDADSDGSADDADAVYDAAGRVCAVDFGDFERGPLHGQPRARKALCEAGLRTAVFRGGVTYVSEDVNTLAAGNLQGGGVALCAVGPNAASLVEDRDTEEVVVPDSARRGELVLRTRRKVTQLFVRLDNDPEDATFVLLRNGAVVATLTRHTDDDDGNGLYALTAAQPGGAFDEVRIVTEGDAPCITAVGVPCAQVPGFDGDGDGDDDNDNKADDDDEYDACDDDDVLADADDYPAHVGGPVYAKRGVADVADAAAAAAAGARAITAVYDAGTHYDVRESARFGGGRLCETRMATFDLGFVQEQLPRRLKHDRLLAYIDFVGDVAVSGSITEPTLQAFPDDSGSKAFCPLQYDAAGIVARERVADDFGTDARVFTPQRGGAEFVIKLRHAVRAAVVEVIVGGGDGGSSGSDSFDVRTLLGAQESDDVRFTDVGSGVLYIAADGPGEFNEIRIRKRGAVASGFCIVAVAARCER